MDTHLATDQHATCSRSGPREEVFTQQRILKKEEVTSLVNTDCILAQLNQKRSPFKKGSADFEHKMKRR